jgi:signal transduction histidine kinase
VVQRYQAQNPSVETDAQLEKRTILPERKLPTAHVALDNNQLYGRGLDPEAVRKAGDSHWGLRGMRERAESIGAEFGIWSGLGAGTEVLVVVSG